MMKTTWVTSALVVMVVTSAAASAADVQHGERLAKQWCSNCHVIGTEQSAGGDAAPPSAAIAETAAERRDELNSWLVDPHPPMPTLNLTRYETDDLIAYIESLDRE